MRKQRDPFADGLLARFLDSGRRRGLDGRALAGAARIPFATFSRWLGPNARRPGKEHLARIDEFLANEAEGPDVDGPRRAARIRRHLEELERDLAWFRDGDAERRCHYRAGLDPFTVGYTASSMTMLFDEAKFQRWKALAGRPFAVAGASRR